ncbi:MAG: hypothetical protein DRJ40_09415 [Thermoprotei archaeon]|nr:MAG: hypothetical protein DRJ40_09415 [Thermoprotei archaeon]
MGGRGGFIRVDARTYELLKRLAAEEGKFMCEIVRDALDLYIERRKLISELLCVLAEVKSTLGHLVERVDELSRDVDDVRAVLRDLVTVLCERDENKCIRYLPQLSPNVERKVD